MNAYQEALAAKSADQAKGRENDAGTPAAYMSLGCHYTRVAAEIKGKVSINAYKDAIASKSATEQFKGRENDAASVIKKRACVCQATRVFTPAQPPMAPRSIVICTANITSQRACDLRLLRRALLLADLARRGDDPLDAHGHVRQPSPLAPLRLGAAVCARSVVTQFWRCKPAGAMGRVLCAIQGRSSGGASRDMAATSASTAARTTPSTVSGTARQNPTASARSRPSAAPRTDDAFDMGATGTRNRWHSCGMCLTSRSGSTSLQRVSGSSSKCRGAPVVEHEPQPVLLKTARNLVHANGDTRPLQHPLGRHRPGHLRLCARPRLLPLEEVRLRALAGRELDVRRE